MIPPDDVLRTRSTASGGGGGSGCPSAAPFLVMLVLGLPSSDQPLIQPSRPPRGPDSAPVLVQCIGISGTGLEVPGGAAAHAPSRSASTSACVASCTPPPPPAFTR